MKRISFVVYTTGYPQKNIELEKQIFVDQFYQLFIQPSNDLTSISQY